MTYQSFLNDLFSLGRFGIKPGLERVNRLLGLVGNPQEKLRAVHVVGTNGKGSTSSFLSSILTAAGYRTGLFTSPHLINFTERIRVNGLEISSDDVLRLGKFIFSVLPPETTFFEIVTTLGCLYFAEQGVDVIVLEAGMGGGNDATAAVPGIMTVVTPISLDHALWLGPDLASIAREKASIISGPVPVISARQDDDSLQAIEAVVRREDSTLVLADRDYRYRLDGNFLRYESSQSKFADLRLGLPGRYQAENAATAIAAAEALASCGFACGTDAIVSGLGSARWAGRMELIPGSPRILLDGAHNAAGAAALAASLDTLHRSKLIGILGVMDDKDLEEIARPLVPMLDRVYCTAPSVGRAVPADHAANRLSALGVSAVPAASVAAALDAARAAASDGDLLLVFGSLYLVGEARACLLHAEYQGVRG